MLVDDHALVRSAVRQALAADDLEIVGEAASADEALLLAPHWRRTSCCWTSTCPGPMGFGSA